MAADTPVSPESPGAPVRAVAKLIGALFWAVLVLLAGML